MAFFFSNGTFRQHVYLCVVQWWLCRVHTHVPKCGARFSLVCVLCAPREARNNAGGSQLWDTNPLLSLLKPSKWLVHIFTIFYSREQMYKAFHVTRTRNIAPFFQAIFPPLFLGRGGQDSAQEVIQGGKKNRDKIKNKWQKQSWMKRS